ncbi:MAG: hypothetical protein NT129_04265 [Candidatus Aenigmarchaeota archaeon]|nr:hypothetical protein [Candidatus Aenigmarchaeota archaeon]
MTRKLILATTLSILVIATFVYAQDIEIKNMGTNTASGRQMYEYTFKFHKGWNLMPPFWYSRGVPAECRGHFKYAFIWTPTKGYVGGALSADHTFNLDNFDAEEREYIQQAFGWSYGVETQEFYISTAAAWVYSDADCTIEKDDEGRSYEVFELRTRKNTSLAAQQTIDAKWPTIKLQKGWNIGVILPDMFFEDKLSDYFKNCQIEKLAIWDPEAQDWDFPPQDQLGENMMLSSPTELDIQEAFGDDEIRPGWYWKTFVIKVADDCSLSYEAECLSGTRSECEILGKCSPDPSLYCMCERGKCIQGGPISE